MALSCLLHVYHYRIFMTNSTHMDRPDPASSLDICRQTMEFCGTMGTYKRQELSGFRFEL